MMAVKTSRRLRLHEDEQDSLLAGVDFQVHYLGSKELLMNDNDIDDVVEDVYSRYLNNAELISTSTRLAVTVGTHQLEFFNVTRNEAEFSIAVSNIEAVHSATKRTKYPSTIILLTYVSKGNATRAYVFHCSSQRKAKELFHVINRSSEYNGTDNSLKDDADESRGKSRNGRVQLKNKDIKGKEKSKDMKRIKCEPETSKDQSGACEAAVQGDMKAKESFQEADSPREKTPVRSTSQTKGAEGVGLLENIDAEDGFDEEFTNLARSRSISNTFKWFGR